MHVGHTHTVFKNRACNSSSTCNAYVPTIMSWSYAASGRPLAIDRRLSGWTGESVAASLFPSRAKPVNGHAIAVEVGVECTARQWRKCDHRSLFERQHPPPETIGYLGDAELVAG